MKPGDVALWALVAMGAYVLYRQSQSGSGLFSNQPEVLYINGFPGYGYGHEPDIINVTLPPTPTPPPPAPPPAP